MKITDPLTGRVHDPARAASPFAADQAAASVIEALMSRRSVRAFRSDPVPRETVEAILAIASRAPSGSNIQPWQVQVLAGEPLASLKAALMATAPEAERTKPPYEYYPVKWFEPYQARRRSLGWALYGTLGIAKGDRERMAAQHARNFVFFDAPVALMFTIDCDLELGSWLDYGMFMQNVMIAARAFGLDTCPQAAVIYPHAVVRRELGLDERERLVCGMALGHARADAPENALVTEREPVEGFARFRGFGAV
jgi:nitroreductase